MNSKIVLSKHSIGPLDTNCYIFGQENGNVIIIDPGFESKDIADTIDNKNLKPIKIVLTHSHYDHIGYANPLSEKFDIPIYIHKEGIPLLEDPDKNLSTFFDKAISIKDALPLEDGDKVEITNELSLEVIHSPGHSECSISLYMQGLLFSGDTIFNQGVGRYDLPGSDLDKLRNSLSKLFKLPDDTIVYPGHGTSTTIAQAHKDISSFAIL
ncbi:MAG: MBL fold metallo-hydrolase [Candidatus Zixiibacteriota bacterium]